MPDETTFKLVSVHFGAEPVAVFRFGYGLRAAGSRWRGRRGSASLGRRHERLLDRVPDKVR